LWSVSKWIDVEAEYSLPAERAKLKLRDVHFQQVPETEQIGPFYTSAYPIRLVQVETAAKIDQDPFAI
jgi:hypothetical protein